MEAAANTAKGLQPARVLLSRRYRNEQPRFTALSGDGTTSWGRDRGKAGAARAEWGCSMESVEQRADCNEGLASNIPQAGTL